MNAKETREAAEAEARYQRSAKAAVDLARDKARRADYDCKAGHLPTCTLTKCDPRCKKES